MLVRTNAALGEYPKRSTERLAFWAAAAPRRAMLSWRGAGGEWESLTYGDALAAVRRIGQALIDRGLSAERPVVILSGNDREHALLSLAAQHVGITVAPLSPAYSTASRDFATLQYAMGLLTPGLIFAAGGAAYDRAMMRPAVPDGVEVVRDLQRLSRPATPTPSIAHTRRSTPDTIAKILLTSGSTAMPKGVVNTHRMLGSNQEMIAHVMPFLRDEPPILVDWLPWHHTFGGNHNIGLVIHHGGTLYLDEGRPLPGQFAASVRNLREIATDGLPERPARLRRAGQGDAWRRGAAADVLQPRARVVLCRGGAGAARGGRDRPSRARVLRRTADHGDRPRRDGNGAAGDLPDVGFAVVGRHRSARA